MIPSHIAVVDTETTGIDPKTCKIVEVALFNGFGIRPANPFLNWVSFVNPGEPIPPEVSAIHHICDEDVVDAPDWNQVRGEFYGRLNSAGITILAAHNVEFDSQFLGLGPDQVWICTYKCALRQWPDAPSHKNEVLKYWLKLGDRGRRHMHGAHSALHDCTTTALILEELLKHQSVETLIEWTKGPKMFSKIAFGKHAGKRWEEIDGGYLVWMCKQPDMDKDLVGCAARELQRRRGG